MSVIWDYLIEKMPYTTEEKAHLLNRLGNEGWELVSIDASSNAYFKKPKWQPGKPVHFSTENGVHVRHDWQ